jgi:hypothetical protein
VLVWSVAEVSIDLVGLDGGLEFSEIPKLSALGYVFENSERGGIWTTVTFKSCTDSSGLAL